MSAYAGRDHKWDLLVIESIHDIWCVVRGGGGGALAAGGGGLALKWQRFVVCWKREK